MHTSASIMQTSLSVFLPAYQVRSGKSSVSQRLTCGDQGEDWSLGPHLSGEGLVTAVRQDDDLAAVFRWRLCTL